MKYMKVLVLVGFIVAGETKPLFTADDQG